MSTSRPTAVGVHCFAGSFTFGVRDRFAVAAQLEVSGYGGATTRRNMPDVDVRVSPTGAWPLDDLVGRVELVYGNPACAPWSPAGARGGAARRDYTHGYDPRDGRVSMFLQAFGLLERLRPRALVIESVPRSWTCGRPFVDPLIAAAAGLGYGCDVVFHDAYDCGAPQHRRRVVYVFTQLLLPWARPAVPGPRTVAEALAGVDPGDRVQPLRPSEAVCLAHTPPGGHLHAAYDQLFGATRLGELRPGQRAGRPSFLDVRLDDAKPAPTCVGGFHYYHPTAARHLTLRETQVLCGYPPTYEFTDRLDTCYRQVAQAVMIPVARWLAGVVADALGAAHARPDTRTLVYDLINDAAPADLGRPTSTWRRVTTEATPQEGHVMTKLDQNVVDRALRKAVEMRLWLNHRSADPIVAFLNKAVDAYEREAQMGFRVLQDHDEPSAEPAPDPFVADAPLPSAPLPFVAAPLAPPARPAAPPPAPAAAPPPAPAAAPPPAFPPAPPPALITTITTPSSGARVAAPPPAWPGAVVPGAAPVAAAPLPAPPPAFVASPPAPVAAPPAPPPTPKPAPPLPQVSPELVEYFRPKLADGATKPRAASELIKAMLRQADPATGTCLYTDLEIAATAVAVYPDLSPLVHRYPMEARNRLKKAGEAVPPARAAR